MPAPRRKLEVGGRTGGGGHTGGSSGQSPRELSSALLPVSCRERGPAWLSVILQRADGRGVV